MATDKAVSHTEFQALVQDVGEVKSILAKVADAINRITLLDERQQTVTAFMQKLDERMGRMEARQHEADINHAISSMSASRMEVLEKGYREMHIDRERDKARFQAVVWMVRGLWAVVTAGGLGLIAKISGVV